MTSVEQAQKSLAEAQALLEQVEADTTRLDETVAWLEEALERAHRLDAYYRGEGAQDVETVLADRADAVTPPVAGEDAAWEALADLDAAVLRMLRVTTAEVTRSLDD
ncbi:hypothetical protein MM440_07005 [Arsenicicoccus piscis]|uniref:DUF4298 domain-containing protein n=1 Tax=Arsenicicoccus piscis TaxID=673954 RepID=A0ABQ6HVX3_9MICO|nr:hypothetical protein [Arsenicicoccus piscis]MCH8627538.1 hypothetical protein [Arsenicicoccus piscis]GMA18007.1 hypothetical protein GCM10025862_00280 [Arsenicicoccus piscis]GMA21720.1 hypothetical protein GCM10025862_37410 [Arsenicicoccus piscis]